MNYYETLGVARDASPEQIKAAYRAQAMAAHPDRGGDHERMSRVNEAYECLSDPERRERYDASDAFLSPAERELIRAFDAAFTNAYLADGHDIIASIRGDFKFQIKQAEIQRAETQKKVAAALRLNARIKTNDGVQNLANALFERALADIEKITAEQQERITTLEAALTLLESYSDIGAPKNADDQSRSDRVLFNHPLFGPTTWTTSSLP